MPLIQVTMIEGRTAEQKRALLTAITDVVQETIGASADSIRVWITDVPADQFMSAGTLAADSRAAAAAADADAEPAEEPPPAAEPGLPPGPAVDPIMAAGGSDRL